MLGVSTPHGFLENVVAFLPIIEGPMDQHTEPILVGLYLTMNNRYVCFTRQEIVDEFRWHVGVASLVFGSSGHIRPFGAFRIDPLLSPRAVTYCEKMVSVLGRLTTMMPDFLFTVPSIMLE